MTLIINPEPIDIFFCDDCFKRIITTEFTDENLYAEGHIYITLRSAQCPICKASLTKDVSLFNKNEDYKDA